MRAEGRRRVAVTGGGTAGHVLPALDFLEVYRREFGAEGCFIGCAPGMEGRLVPARGVRLETIPGLPVARQDWFGKLRAAACLPAAVRAARRMLLRERIQLVIGAGGYASFSACAAAYTLGLPVAIHEANVEPGVANRLLARIAALVCVGSAESARHFHRPVLVTGVPCGRLERSRPPAGPPWRFLVLGGSEGSPLLNREAPPLFAELRRRGVALSVHHLAGAADRQAVARAYADGGVTAEVNGFVDDMAPLYARAAMAITSAGARTLAELSAAGIPSVVVPLPGSARNHQLANARLYAEQTGAAAILGEQWDRRAVAARIEALLANRDELARVAHRTAECARPQAAREVVQACENILAARQAAGVGARLPREAASL